MTSDEDSGSKTRKPNIKIRQMEIDDVAAVFHLGEKLYQAEKTPNLYRTWDEYEVIDFYQSDPEFCLVAESENTLVGIRPGHDHHEEPFGMEVRPPGVAERGSGLAENGGGGEALSPVQRSHARRRRADAHRGHRGGESPGALLFQKNGIWKPAGAHLFVLESGHRDPTHEKAKWKERRTAGKASA